MKQAYFSVVLFFFLQVRSQAPDWAWARTSSGGADSEARNMVVDPAGNVYVTGYFSSASVAFAATTLTNSGAVGTSDFYLAKFDRTGALQWAKRAAGTDDDEGLSVTVDAAGNIYTTGFFESPTITFGTTVLTNNSSNGLSDVFVAKYNSAGTVLWASSFGGSQEEIGNAIRSDASGNVYLVGDFSSLSVQFGTYGVINGGVSDIFLTKFNTSGTPQWSKRIGGGQTDNGRDIAIDANGNIIVTGHFNSTSISTFSPALTSAGGYDFFFARYDGSGNILSASRFGGTSDEISFAITTNTSGDFFIGGSFKSTSLQLGSLSLTNSGNRDMFFVKFSGTGTALWASKANGNNTSAIADLVTDPSGNLYSAGQFNIASTTFTGITTINNSGGSDGYVVKFNGATGSGIWALHTSSAGEEKLSGVGIGGDGFVVVAGSYNQTLTLGANILSGGSGMNSVISKLCFAPAGPVSATGVTVCAGQSANLSGVTPPGTTPAWFNSSTGGTLLSTSATYSPPAPGVYYLASKDTNSGCGMYSSARISASLSVHPAINAGVTVSGHTLTATGQGSVTTWYDCDKKAAMQGQTANSYVINASGSYAVIMSANGCADTSACDVYSFTPGTPTVIINTGISENYKAPQISAYPNPNNGGFTFKAVDAGKYKMFNLLGETISIIEITEENKKGVYLSGFADGIYFISDKDNRTCLRIIVNR